MSSSSTWRPDGLSGTGAPAAWSSVQPASARWKTATASSARIRRRPSRSTGTGAAPARPASASASARARAPSAARRAASETKRAHDRGDGEEDRQREQVLALLDRERVHRRREIPVDEQEADDGRGERGPDAADRRDHDDEQEEEQQDARQPEVGAEVRQDPGQQRQPDRREHEAELHAAPGERAGPPRPGGRRRRSVVGAADHVHVEADAGVADHAVDHRAARQLGESRAARRAEDDLRRVERVGCRTSASPISAPTTSRYVPPSSSTSSRWRSRRSAAPPASPSCGRTWTAKRSPFERAAMRAARRTRRSPSAEPVSATTTRSRVSQGRSIPWRSR